MKQSLQLKFSQNLALTPQLQQSIRLLQLSSQELNQELETILQENPLLERTDKNDDGSENTEFFSPSHQTLETSASKETAESSQQDYPQDFTGDEYFGVSSHQRWEENNHNDDDGDYTFQEAEAPTLREHLISQLHLMQLSERDQTLSQYLVDAINEDGYLEQSLEELSEL